MDTTPKKKKHHYVPVAYLRRFTDTDGMLYVYRKDAPDQVRPSRPESIAYRNYYYSQPRPDGSQDNSVLEDLFSKIESDWPCLCDNLVRRQPFDRDATVSLLGFIGLQRVRVPAARDMVEGVLARDVMGTLRQLQATGELPPPPDGLRDLIDHVVVSIDPHQSIHAMPGAMQALGPLLDTLGYEILHNETGRSFVTSDNPVALFDPTVGEKDVQPYDVNGGGGPVELLFPVTPHIVVRGHPSCVVDSCAKERVIRDCAMMPRFAESIG